MGKLQYLVIHCADTRENFDLKPEHIKKWHMSPKPKGRGWKRLGYSDMINLQGELINLTLYNEDSIIENHEMTWGAKGINSISRHIVLAGGRDINNKPANKFNENQLITLKKYCEKFIKNHPNCKIAGHYHFSDKTCPNFDVEFFLLNIGIPYKNIYTNSK